MFSSHNPIRCSTDMPSTSSIDTTLDSLDTSKNYEFNFTELTLTVSSEITVSPNCRKSTSTCRHNGSFSTLKLHTYFFIFIALSSLLISSTSALPISVGSNDNYVIETVPLQADVVPAVFSSVPIHHTPRRALRRILRNVEREIKKREIEEEQQIFASGSTPFPSTNQPKRLRGTRSQKSEYPKICYFSPIQCIFTRDRI